MYPHALAEGSEPGVKTKLQDKLQEKARDEGWGYHTN
jgi:hypothetical protein